jgi:hypothetical protein
MATQNVLVPASLLCSRKKMIRAKKGKKGDGPDHLLLRKMESGDAFCKETISCKSKKSISKQHRFLVSLVTQIGGQSFDGARAALREDVFGVMGDDERLFRASDDDSLLSLNHVSEISRDKVFWQ